MANQQERQIVQPIEGLDDFLPGSAGSGDRFASRGSAVRARLALLGEVDALLEVTALGGASQFRSVSEFPLSIPAVQALSRSSLSCLSSACW